MLYDRLIKHILQKEGPGFIPEYVIPFYNGEIGIENVLQDFEGDPFVDISLKLIKAGKGLKRILNYKIL